MSNEEKSIIATATPRLIEEAKKHLEKAKAPVATVTALTPKERLRVLKPRRGGRQVVVRVAELASQYGLELEDMSGDEIVALMDSAARLRGLLAAIEQLRASVKDAVLRSENEAWKYTIAAYGALRGIAKARPVLGTSLVEVEEAFRSRRRRVTHATPPTPKPPAPPATNGSPAPHGAPSQE
jgi:hypothetical protein